jgi:hypothetical protein
MAMSAITRMAFGGSLPPPPTTKIGYAIPFLYPPLYLQSSRITAPAGYQAEYHIYLVGLDIEEKARWTEEQIRESIGEERFEEVLHAEVPRQRILSNRCQEPGRGNCRFPSLCPIQ